MTVPELNTRPNNINSSSRAVIRRPTTSNSKTIYGHRRYIVRGNCGTLETRSVDDRFMSSPVAKIKLILFLRSLKAAVDSDPTLQIERLTVPSGFDP